jgi:cysteine desulfurase/selenocysteine lyase
VPWQELAKRKGAKLELVKVTEEGLLDLEYLAAKIKAAGSKLKILAYTSVSNTLGTSNPIREINELCRLHAPQAKIVIDGAQHAPHAPVNFNSYDADFFAISAHKMLGPMGIGALLVKEKTLKELAPFLFGGGMIEEVLETSATYAENLEERFTAGTPDVAGLVGWAAACDYLSKLDMSQVLRHDQQLVEYCLAALAKLPQLKIIGPNVAQGRIGSVAFLYEGVHAHDVGQILDSEGVAVRSGHHCTMPLHTKFEWPATVRVSFQIYNMTADIDALVSALTKVKMVFGK